MFPTPRQYGTFVHFLAHAEYVGALGAHHLVELIDRFLRINERLVYGLGESDFAARIQDSLAKKLTNCHVPHIGLIANFAPNTHDCVFEHDFAVEFIFDLTNALLRVFSLQNLDQHLRGAALPVNSFQLVD